MSDETKDAAPVDAAAQSEADSILAEFDHDAIANPPGRSETEPATAGAADIPTGKLCGDLLDITFNALLAPKRGEHWKMTGEESTALGDAYGAVIDKWFPDLSGGPEVTAVVLSLAMFGPRIAVDMMAHKVEANDSEAGAASMPAGEYVTDADE